MKRWIVNNIWVLAGVILGGVGGYFYWQQVGCESGTCMITSKWHNSTAYGAIMGGLLLSILKPARHGNNKSEGKL